MKKILEYINKLNEFNTIVEELDKIEQGNNKLIDKTKEYNLYAGKHVFDRLYRNVEQTYNIGDKISLKQVIDTVNKGFYHILNCHSSNKLKVGDSTSAICITNKKYNIYLNVVVYINKINIDGILSSGIIKNLIEKENKSIFPIIMSTERPYMACKYLLNGNAVILVDNDPFALILPISLNDFFFSEEDEYSGSINTSFSRIIRYICFIISLITPALYIAITTYNQEIIPTPLLLSIAGQRENVPFSAFIEAILMIFSFDILRESDLKMPNFANSSLSIVGALILGDAAVSAGIVSPIMIIVVAITSISSLAFSEPELINSLRWYRLIFMLGASFFGIYGLVLVGLYFLITTISTKSFTLPYLSPFAPINISQLKDSIISYPIKKRKKRNNYLSNNIVKNKTEE